MRHDRFLLFFILLVTASLTLGCGDDGAGHSAMDGDGASGDADAGSGDAADSLEIVGTWMNNFDGTETISNDSWFGDSIGPWQHLQIAQMRGRENGRFVLRGTNNGISAIIDHQGRIVKRTDQFEATTLTGEAEVMLGSTPFSSFGNTPIIAGCFSVLLLMALMYLGFWRDD